MEYKFFDRQFLLFPDDACVGKMVFFNDTYTELIKEVESGDFVRTDVIVAVNADFGAPFVIHNNEWILAYYDPNYKVKVAYSQGKQIQYKRSGGEWVDVDAPLWVENGEYRVKPDETWYVHPSEDEYGNCIGHPFYKDMNNKIFVSFEGTEKECDAWIAEHTPKTRRMTNKELARWCADNKGQWSSLTNNLCNHAYYYDSGDDIEVPNRILIREWNSNEWHEPLVVMTDA